MVRGVLDTSAWTRGGPTLVTDGLPLAVTDGWSSSLTPTQWMRTCAEIHLVDTCRAARGRQQLSSMLADSVLCGCAEDGWVVDLETASLISSSPVLAQCFDPGAPVQIPLVATGACFIHWCLQHTHSTLFTPNHSPCLAGTAIAGVPREELCLLSTPCSRDESRHHCHSLLFSMSSGPVIDL